MDSALLSPAVVSHQPPSPVSVDPWAACDPAPHPLWPARTPHSLSRCSSFRINHTFSAFLVGSPSSPKPLNAVFCKRLSLRPSSLLHLNPLLGDFTQYIHSTHSFKYHVLVNHHQISFSSPNPSLALFRYIFTTIYFISALGFPLSITFSTCPHWIPDLPQLMTPPSKKAKWKVSSKGSCAPTRGWEGADGVIRRLQLLEKFWFLHGHSAFHFVRVQLQSKSFSSDSCDFGK